MSLCLVQSRALLGLDAAAVTVEVHLSNGLPNFRLVGLADTEVKEARERVRSALIASGLALPAKRITVNLAPADLPKEGSHYDLPLPEIVQEGQWLRPRPGRALEVRVSAG